MNRIRLIRIVFSFFFLLPVLFAGAQPAAMDASFRNYFRNPLAIPMQLSANFGELRPDHWHMGLDIRTGAKENLPVYAAAEGYIAKIGVRPQSFGRFIIINHPNGLSTLYGHLNDFFDGLENYVREQQYKQESWAVELEFAPAQFPLSKGAFIAYSGNTGGSRGPHLHFEIFDTKTEKRLNPLLFNFPVTDQSPPVLSRLALYDRSRSVYAQTPQLFSLKYTDSGYIIPKVPVIKTGLNRISFAIRAIDRTSGGGSDNGIYSAKLYLDEEPQVCFVLDSIDYDETLYMNAHIDYRYDYNGGPYLQHVSRMTGDNGPVYKRIKNDGIIRLEDTAVHHFSIDVKDPQGNTAQLNFSVQYLDSLAKNPVGIPGPVFIPNAANLLEREDLRVQFPEGCFYDTLPVVYYRTMPAAYTAVTAGYQVNDPSYPVHKEFTVSIKPYKTIPEEWKDRLLMQRSGKGNSLRKVKLENGWLSARFADFGTFQVLADLLPPEINSPGKGDTINLSAASRIVFTPTDNFGVIRSFRVEIDSQWIRFTNDKTRNWIYVFDEKVPYGVHQLTATATDLAGNVTRKTWWFKRYPYTPPPPKKKGVKKTVKKSSSKKPAPRKK